LSLFFVLTALFEVQSIDIKWFDSTWEPLPGKKGAAYFRIVEMDSITQHYLATDYYSSGELYRTASYVSLEPEIRDGKFTWYYSNGRIQKEVVYEENKVVSYKVLNKTGEDELSVLMNLKGKHGEAIVEPMKVDKEPTFFGGNKALEAYKKDSLIIPNVVWTHMLEGCILVFFIVREDGSITDVRLMTKIHPDLDNEAIRFVSSMPRWNSALVDKTPVAVPYIFSVYFH